MKVEVNIQFVGTVKATVPKGIPEDQAIELAKKMVLARVLATMENPDAPEDAACMEYRDEFELSDEVAEEHWDNTRTGDVGGEWLVLGTDCQS
jgi:hypothetical protein